MSRSYYYRVPGSRKVVYGTSLAPLEDEVRFVYRERDERGKLVQTRTFHLRHTGELTGLPFYEEPSALFAPTEEQAKTSALLAACHANRLTEREVIERLWQEHKRLLDEMVKLASAAGSPMLVFGGPR